MQNRTDRPGEVGVCRPKSNYAAAFVSVADHMEWMRSAERELEEQAASQAATMTGKTLPDLALLCAIMAFWNLQKLSFYKGTQCNIGS